MKRMLTKRSAAGVLLLVFGLLCLNDTRAGGLEHHKAVARRHGLPAPGEHILLAGAVAIVCGAGLIGYEIGRGKRR